MRMRSGRILQRQNRPWRRWKEKLQTWDDHYYCYYCYCCCYCCNWIWGEQEEASLPGEEGRVGGGRETTRTATLMDRS